MSLTVQIRHATAGVDTADYWVGFIIHHHTNTPQGPMPRVQAIEIAALNLGIQEERRVNGGFAFPLVLHKAQRSTVDHQHDRTIISRFYAQIIDPALAFAKFDFIKRVDLLIARRTGTLAALGMPASLHLFRGDSQTPFAKLPVNENWWSQRGVSCTLYSTDDTGRLVPTAAPSWMAANEFNGTIESYTSASEAAEVERLARQRDLDAAKKPTLDPRKPGELPPKPEDIHKDSQPIHPDREAPLVSPGNPWLLYFGLAMIGVVGFLIWYKNQSPTPPSEVVVSQSTPSPSPAPSAPGPGVGSGSPQPVPAPAPNENGGVQPPVPPPVPVTSGIEIPVGNSNVTRDDLYKFGFNDHLTAVRKTLSASRELNKAEFDSNAEWLRLNRPTLPAWSSGDAKARRAFNEGIELLVNHGKTLNDHQKLSKAVDLSERFLTSHFGLSTAHLNLSIAQSALGNGKAALAPAFHTIVFNPDGANGWVALGVALARSGDADGATNAFCSALRKTKFSNKTVTYFEKVARGEDLTYPEVTQSMSRALGTACPRGQWE